MAAFCFSCGVTKLRKQHAEIVERKVRIAPTGYELFEKLFCPPHESRILAVPRTITRHVAVMDPATELQATRLPLQKIGSTKDGIERRVTSFLHTRVDRNPIYFPGLAAVC